MSSVKGEPMARRKETSPDPDSSPFDDADNRFGDGQDDLYSALEGNNAFDDMFEDDLANAPIQVGKKEGKTGGKKDKAEKGERGRFGRRGKTAPPPDIFASTPPALTTPIKPSGDDSFEQSFGGASPASPTGNKITDRLPRREVTPPRVRTKTPGRGSAISIRRVLGGFFGIVARVIVALPLMLALAFAIVLGARTFGIALPEVDPFAAAAETQTVSLDNIDSVELTPEPTVIAALPTLVPVCPGGAEWWAENAQNYAFFTTIIGNLTVLPTDSPVAPILDNARTRRERVNTTEAPPCIEAAKIRMVAGFDRVITGIERLFNADVAGARLYDAEATPILVDVLPLVWDQAIATGENTPPAVLIARNGSPSAEPGCAETAAAWAAEIDPQWAAFNERLTTAAAIDLETVEEAQVTQLTGELRGIRARVIDQPADGCVATAHALAVDAMEGLIRLVESTLAGELAAARAAYGAALPARYTYEAWRVWLGV